MDGSLAEPHEDVGRFVRHVLTGFPSCSDIQCFCQMLVVDRLLLGGHVAVFDAPFLSGQLLQHLVFLPSQDERREHRARSRDSLRRQ